MTTDILFTKKQHQFNGEKMPIQQMLLEKLEKAGEYEKIKSSFLYKN